jgi:hypothetical protein
MDTDATLARLDDQISWYDRKSAFNQRWFKRLKFSQLIAAAMVPVAASGGAPRLILGGLGAFVVVLEGLQGLNQFQHNWITYRSTCEELKHEKFLWMANAGPYATANDRDALLAERVEAMISREHAKWVSAVQENKKQKS